MPKNNKRLSVTGFADWNEFSMDEQLTNLN